jgi:hypothetical protein
MVKVLLHSRPQRAHVIGPDGISLGRTPTFVEVEPGKPVAVVLKLKRYKELSVSIDGLKEKVTLRLDRLPATPRRDPGEIPDGDLDPDTTPDPGDEKEPDDCATDPNSVDCRCQKDPSLPICYLE